MSYDAKVHLHLFKIPWYWFFSPFIFTHIIFPILSLQLLASTHDSSRCQQRSVWPCDFQWKCKMKTSSAWNINQNISNENLWGIFLPVYFYIRNTEVNVALIFISQSGYILFMASSCVAPCYTKSSLQFTFSSLCSVSEVINLTPGIIFLIPLVVLLRISMRATTCECLCSVSPRHHQLKTA